MIYDFIIHQFFFVKKEGRLDWRKNKKSRVYFYIGINSNK